jgi:hypothetical protein
MLKIIVLLCVLFTACTSAKQRKITLTTPIANDKKIRRGIVRQNSRVIDLQ